MKPFQSFVDDCKKISGEYSKLLKKPPEKIEADIALPCFSFSKNPTRTAKELAEKFKKRIESTLIGDVSAIGPYVNFYINYEKFSKLVLNEILKEKNHYGSSDKADAEK